MSGQAHGVGLWKRADVRQQLAGPGPTEGEAAYEHI